MKNYNDLGPCPVCEKNFTQADDIVVCPECGAPYHRECYNSIGQCKYEEKHSPEFSYFDTYTNKQNAKNKSTNQKKCPRCLNDNPDDSLFCTSCGFPFLTGKNNQGFNNAPEINPFNFDPFAGIDKNETIDDIKVSEFAEYIKSNVLYYISVLKKIKDKNKSRFNFSAFLFSGGWFLYRKLYKIGIILTTIVTLLMISSTFFELTYVQDILLPVLHTAGINSPTDFSVDNYNSLITQLSLLPPEKKFILVLPSILNIINFIIMLVSGFTANKIYLKHCKSNIKKIKTLCKDDQRLYAEEIAKHGGVNLRMVPFLLICYIIIEYLPRFLI